MTEREMKGKSVSRSGSVSVLLMCLLASLITVFGLMYETASFRTLKQVVSWNGENAGQAVLSYYLPELKERYDLYGVWKEPSVLEWRMKQFVEGSSPFWKGETGSGLLNAVCEQITVDSEDYLFMDPDLVKEQIDDVMEYGAVIDLIRETELIDILKEVMGLAGAGMELQDSIKLPEIQRSGEDRTSETTKPENEEEQQLEQKWAQLKQQSDQKKNQGESAMEAIEVDAGRILKDPEIIKALPSRQSDLSMESFWEILTQDFSQLGKVIQSSLYTDLYGLHYFGNYVERQDGWFIYQLEYILQGELSDQENVEKTKRDLFFLRTILNTAAIYRDDTLRNGIGALAVAAAPIPYSVAFGVLAAAFGAAEAGEDVKNLMDGGAVPALKNAGQWTALPEGSAGAKDENGTEGRRIGEMDQKTVGAEESAGSLDLSYENHLHVLLLLRSQETKILRMMDLIQLDLQRSFGESFTLSDVCVGFHWELDVTGKNSTGKERYWTCEGVSQYGGSGQHGS